MNKLHIVPIKQKEAFAYITKHHRHHKKPVGSVFQIACAVDGIIVGVVTVGRPVSKELDNGYTLEVNRLCTDGTPNACSILYSAAWRATKALGWTKLITYILDSESGVSLYASNWRLIGEAGSSRGWSVPSRPRVDTNPKQKKLLFEAS